MLAATENLQRIPRRRDRKFSERKKELAEAALATLASLGFARTSLREIAQHFEFSHGVLHYYFADKADLITYCVRLYKARRINHYDRVIAEAADYASLVDGVLDTFAAGLRDEPNLHRLWYDLRIQALYEESFRADVADIDSGMEAVIWKALRRCAEITGVATPVTSSLAYSVFDGLFQRALIRHLSGDPDAIDEMYANGRRVFERLYSGSD